MKQIAFSVHEMREGIFTEAELTYLKEESFESNLNNNGEVNTKLKKKIIPTEANFRFAFKSYARAFDSDYTLDLSDDNWQSFKDALEIRHRLTHPKFIVALNISDKDLQRVEKAFGWYRDVTLGLLRSKNFLNRDLMASP